MFGHLLAWVTGTLTLLRPAMMAIGYAIGSDEAVDLTDSHLLNAANLV